MSSVSCPWGSLYFVTAALAAALTRFNGGVAFLWVSNALLMAALMMEPRRRWRYALFACGVASMLATGLFGFGWPLSLPFAAINLVEAVIAAWIFRRLGNPLQPLGSLSWLVVFTVAAGLVAPFVAAVLATVAVSAAGLPSETMLPFFAGHALGNLTVAPLALLVARRSRRLGNLDVWKQRAAEGILLFAVVAGITTMVFTQPQLPLLFLPILPIILVTFRLGRTGAAVAIVLLAVIGGGATLFGIGPIQLLDGRPARMQYFQFYLAATVLTVLPVAADLENRRRLHRNMRLSEQRYRLLAQHSSDILLHMDRDARIRYISPSIVMAGGRDPTKLIGQYSSVLVVPDFRAKALSDFRETLAARGQTRTFEYLAATVDGKLRWFETHSRAIIDDEGVIDGVMSVIRDVSARKANEQRLAEDAQTDPLTGLLNRRAFRRDRTAAEHCRRRADRLRRGARHRPFQGHQRQHRPCRRRRSAARFRRASRGEWCANMTSSRASAARSSRSSSPTPSRRRRCRSASGCGPRFRRRSLHAGRRDGPSYGQRRRRAARSRRLGSLRDDAPTSPCTRPSATAATSSPSPPEAFCSGEIEADAQPLGLGRPGQDFVAKPAFPQQQQAGRG